MRDVPGGVDISRQRRLWHWPRSKAPKSGNAFVRLSHFCGFFLDGQTPFMEHMKASVYSLFLFLGECTPVSFSKGTLSQTLGQSSDPESSDMSSGWFTTNLIHHFWGRPATLKWLHLKKNVKIRLDPPQTTARAASFSCCPRGLLQRCMNRFVDPAPRNKR